MRMRHVTGKQHGVVLVGTRSHACIRMETEKVKEKYLRKYYRPKV
jgi:hypothetical protein